MIQKLNIIIRLSVTFRNDSAKSQRRAWHSTLAKMIVMRILLLITIISKCSCRFLRPETTVICNEGKLFILRMHMDI